MKNKFDARIFVVAALAVALVASTGCRSGWKLGNPFSKAPKATDVDTPSELDALNDLTPPPENYTVGAAEPQKVDAERSLAQKGKYEADETPKLAQTPDDASALAQNTTTNASNAALASEPTQSFKTPDYSQSFQSADNFQVAQAPQTAQTPTAAQSYQAPAPNAAQQYAATAPYVPAQPPQTDFPTVEPNAFPVAQSAPVAPQTDFPTVEPNAFPVAQSAPVAPQNDFPTVEPNAFPVAQSAPVAPQADFPTVEPNAFPVAQNAPVAPTQATYVAQNFPEPAPQAAPAAATQDAYSGVHYQPQTTSGGFAPGSVGVY